MANPLKLVSITQNDPSLVQGGPVHYTVTFSEPVTGVDASIFTLQTSGITGAAITSVTAVAGSNGAQYTVSVGTGTGDGTLHLVLAGAAATGIQDAGGNHLPGGGFQPKSIGASPGLSSAVFQDVNGDGKPDWIGVYSQSVGFNIGTHGYIEVNNGDGSFRSTQLPDGLLFTSLFAADLNHDGKPDLISRGYGSYDGIDIQTGNGNGTFSLQHTYAAGLGNLSTLTIGDFNGDGNVDIVSGQFGATAGFILCGNGDASFQAPRSFSTGVDDAAQWATGDFNHDGKLDLVVVSATDQKASVLLGNGDGTFQAPRLYGVNGQANNFITVAAADLNGDGNLDFVVGGGTSTTVMLGGGTGTFQISFQGVGGSLIGIADVNSDGALDVLLSQSNSTSGQIAALLGNGNGTFQSAKIYSYPVSSYRGNYYSWGGTLADVNGDGRVDILAGSGLGDAIDMQNVIPDVVSPTYTIDSIPVVSSVGSSRSNTILFTGQTDSFTLTMSKGVTVSGGTPTLSLNDGGIAVYDPVHSTATNLVFQYAVQFGENTGGLAVTGLNLNGASITDVAGTPADLSGTAKTFSGLQVDTATQIIFYNNYDGRIATWQVVGAAPVAEAIIDQVTTDWRFDGVAHLANGNLLNIFQNSDGRVVDGQTNGFQHALANSVVGYATPDWQLIGTGDVFRDGNLDFVWRNGSGGPLAVWEMDPTGRVKVAGDTLLPGPSADWRAAGIGSFTGDGHTELLWQNNDGRVAEWTFNGQAGNPGVAGTIIDSPSLEWRVAAVGDANGDGRADVFYFNMNDGRIAERQMNGTQALSDTVVIGQVTTDWSIVGARDFTGDAKADLLFRNSTGDVALWQLSGTQVVSKNIVDHITSDWLAFL